MVVLLQYVGHVPVFSDDQSGKLRCCLSGYDSIPVRRSAAVTDPGEGLWLLGSTNQL